MKITEEEIRPEKVFNEYLELAKQDIQHYFKDAKKREISCPVCNTEGQPWISKSGFQYKKCPNCFTIFVSPRPVREAFDAYYTDSPSTKFWATNFYKNTESARRVKIWKPKAQIIKEKIRKYGNNIQYKSIVDIGGGYGVFAEEIKLIMDVELVIIEPSVHLADICRSKGLLVIEKLMEDIIQDELPKSNKCFVCFELFEHLFDPTFFLQKVFDKMYKNDFFIFTTLNGIGLDIQVLGKHAKALSPPHHLNFLNPKSASSLLESIGFSIIETSTPGKLDIDILKNNKQYINNKTKCQFF